MAVTKRKLMKFLDRRMTSISKGNRKQMADGRLIEAWRFVAAERLVSGMGINIKIRNPSEPGGAAEAKIKLEKDLRSCMRCEFFYGSSRQCIAVVR